MRKSSFLLAAIALFTLSLFTLATAGNTTAKAGNKRLLLVTHSGGFIHGSVATAEEVLKDIGPKNGFDVTCWRFTEDPDKKVKGKDGKEVNALDVYSERFRGSTKLTVA